MSGHRKSSARLRMFLRQLLMAWLMLSMVLPNQAWAEGIEFAPAPPFGPPPGFEGPGPRDGPSDSSPFRGDPTDFGEPSDDQWDAGGSFGNLGKFGPGGEFAPWAYAGDDDIGGQGSGGEGRGLGADGPAGIGSGKGTGTSDGFGAGASTNGSRMPGLRNGTESLGFARIAIVAVALVAIAAACRPPGDSPPPPPPKDPPPPPADPPPPPEVTRDPIFMRHGAATENAVDLEVPGPLGPWRYSRSYNSMDGVRNAATRQGNGWLTNQADRRMSSVNVVPVLNAQLIDRADSQLSFSRTTGAQPFSVSGSDWKLTHDATAHEFTVTNPRTGEVWVYHDSSGSNGSNGGKLKVSTTLWWKGANKLGYRYAYSSSTGLLNQITTPQGQEYNIVFGYDLSKRIKSIEVRKPPGAGAVPIMKAEYTYFDATLQHDEDIGSPGDLVQVKVSRLTSGGTDITIASNRVERYTQYRYDSDSRLEAIFNHDGIYSLMQNHSLSSPSDILTKPDNDAVGGHQVKDFADRIYEYYTENILDDTFVAQTVFAPGTTENLMYKYNAGHTNKIGMVKKGTDRPNGCASCGSGSAGGIRYDYYYMARAHGPTPGYNDVVWIVVEDISNSESTPIKRRVFGINNWGHILRQATIKNPAGSPTYWCASRTFTAAGMVAEYRLHSAHTMVDTESDLQAFLDPSTSTNDSSTLNDSTGLIWLYDYDGSNRQIATKIKKGELGEDGNGISHYDSYIEYTSGTEGTNLAKKLYTFPTRVSDNPPTASGDFVQYIYTFWDTDTRLRVKTREIIPPVVNTDANGSNQSTHLWEYYDESGRLRWTKNGDGYVTYRAYNPVTGSLAFQMRDVDTTSLGTEIVDGDNPNPSGTDLKWEAWGSSAVPDSNFVRNTALPPGALKIVTKNEYDDQGRIVRRIYPRGNQTYLRYDKDKTLIFPYVNASTGMPALPVTVTGWNDAHRNTEVYTVDPSKTTTNGSGVPTGISATQSDYLSWMRNIHDPVSGALTQVDVYHNIPSSGTGGTDPGPYYYSTWFLHTPMGLSGATVQYVDTNKYQVTATVYDMHDRPIEARRSVVTSPSITYSTAAGYTKVAEVEYDGGGVGSGYVTSAKRYYGTGSSDYVKTTFYRTFRSHLRGIKRSNGNDGDGDGANVKPYTVMDVDWLGRTTALAQYIGSSEPTWPTGYTDYVYNFTSGAPSASGHNNVSVTRYDDLGRVFRTEHYPGTEAAKHFETNNYYDRRSNLVASGDKYGAHSEMAYDGCARQYQGRTVVQLSSSSPFGITGDDGAFEYVAPLPTPSFASITGGNGGVIELSHTAFDANANALEDHEVELNHDDSNGISLTSGTPTGGVRTTTHDYYDAAGRLVTNVYYGAADENDGATTWKSSGLPTRDTGTSTTFTSSVDRLVTQYVYDPIGGDLELVTDAAGIKTKTFNDDLGRRTFVAEYFHNFSPPTTGIGGSSNQDRVTAWEYNGLNSVKKLTAYNGSSSNSEITEYQYATDTNNYDASLVTLTKYPDGNTATSGSPQDNVQMTYKLDGSLATMKDQRGVVLTYTYDDARRRKRQGATTVPGGVDGAIKSIARTYDPLGRVEKITSWSGDSGSGTVQNEIKYTYGAHGQVSQADQDHVDAVGSGTGNQSVQYVYDETAPTANIYDDGLRLQKVTYPKTSRVIWFDYGESDDAIADRLDRIKRIREDSASGTVLTAYSYNGTARLVSMDYPGPEVYLQGYAFGSYYRYDRFGRVAQSKWVKGGSGAGNLDLIYYGYDFAGNRKWREDVVASDSYSKNLDEYYGYDNLYRLLAVDRGNLTGGPTYTGVTSTNFTQDWALDQLGNWAQFYQNDDGVTPSDLDQERSHNVVNEITSISIQSGGNGPNWADPLYDAAGNMTTIPKPWSPTSTYTLVYDAWNRLVEVRGPSLGNLQQQNEYDGLGRRIVRVDAVADPDVTYDYYYNEQWQLLEERKGGDPDPLAQYVWHPYYVDALAVRYYDAGTSSSQVQHYYCQDANYNVTAVVNSSGTVLERYNYMPYGEVTFLDANFAVDADQISDIGNTHLYTGRERDPETGLQLNRHRYYASHLGRWLTRDPLEYDSGDLNLFTYVNSNPLYYVDPSGDAGYNPVPPWEPDPNIPPGNEQECAALESKIRNIMKDIAKRLEDLSLDEWGLPGTTDDDNIFPRKSRRGHWRLVNELKKRLDELTGLYDWKCRPPIGVAETVTTYPILEWCEKYLPAPVIYFPIPGPAPHPRR